MRYDLIDGGIFNNFLILMRGVVPLKVRYTKNVSKLRFEHVKFSFSEKATKICGNFLMVLTFAK